MVNDYDYPELNRLLLERIVNWALAPEQSRAWRQEWWLEPDPDVEVETPSGRHVCGTSACIAGWTVLDQATDGQLVPVDWLGEPRVLLVPIGLDVTGMSYREMLGYAVDVEREARLLLGLTVAEAALLFAGDNSENSIRRIADKILDGEYR